METIKTPESSNIARYGWGDNGKLFVEFKSGDRWEYDAPRRVFDEMKKAKSVGSFFYAKVRGKVKGRQVDSE
jgi:hypothetical protein